MPVPPALRRCRIRRRDGIGGAVLFALAILYAPQALAIKLDVRLTGLSGEYEANVLALLRIYQERDDPDLSVLRLETLHRRAPDEIRRALEPFGFYRVEVEASLTRPAAEDGTWVASYRVDPGEPVRVRSVDYRIEGPGAGDSAFPQRFPMQEGDVLLHSEYEKAKESIRRVAASRGYLDFQATRHQVVVDLADDAADISLHIDTGERYFLGDVTFSQDLLDDRYLERFVRFDRGDTYDPETLLALQGTLISTEYFERVEIVPQKEQADAGRRVPILVETTPSKPNKYRFGLGYGTDTGPRATLEWRRRYLTRRGHKFKLEAGISEPLQRLEGDYRIPVGDPVADYISIRPELEAYDTASRQGEAVSLQVAHSVLTPGGWRRTAGIDYRKERYEIATEDEAVDELVPNVTWAKTVTDDPIYTTNGYRIKCALLGSLEGVVSPSSYLGGSVRVKMIRSFFDDYRLIARTDLGATFADSLSDLPASRRYFAGGDTSIRGWGLEVLGPNDPVTNETLGGRYLAVGSLELERRIAGKWSGAVFTDFGNAFDPDFDRDVQVGSGFGVRWLSPIGQVRVDLAFALTKQDEGARLHIVIGPDL